MEYGEKSVATRIFVIFWSAYPNQTILVTVGKVRPLSDIEDRHIVRMTNDRSVRLDLAPRLFRAGCPVKLDTDWHTSGDFNPAEQ